MVESVRPKFRSTFQAEPTKAVKIALFQEVGDDQKCQNFAAIKTQVRAIVGREAGPAQEVQASAIPEEEPAEQPAEQPAQDSQDFAIAKKAPTD